MKVSVLMSVYAKESPLHLDAALRSITQQTTPPGEIVVIEDGPLTDELYNVLDRYSKLKGANIKRYSLESNQGLGAALRYGVNKCKYEWIARMDSDDVSISDRLEKQVAYLAKHQEVDMIGSMIDEYDDALQYKTGTRSVPESHDEIVQYMRSRSPFNHMTVMYRKSLVLEAGNYQNCPYFEDYYLWCRMQNVNAIFYNIQESLVKARAGASMLKRRGGAAYIRHLASFYGKIYRLGVINQSDLVKNIFVRTIVASAPHSIRGVFYSKFLRKKEIELRKVSPKYKRDLVSVVITTYKRPIALERAIRSVLNQTYPNIEIIVVDDNSNGDVHRRETESLMRQFNHLKNVYYIKHKRNMNGATARNTGIKMAKGEFITFLDDDDFFMSERIDILIDAMSRNGKKNSCAYSAVAFMYKNRLVNIKRPMSYPDYRRELLMQNSFFGTGSNFLCNTDTVRKIGGFDTKFSRHQDIEFMIRILKHSSLVSVNEVLVVKCADSVMNVPNPDKSLQVNKLFLGKFKPLIDSYSMDEIKLIKYRNYIGTARNFALNRRPQNEELRNALENCGGVKVKDLAMLSVLRLLASFGVVYRAKYFIRSIINIGPNRRETDHIYSTLNESMQPSNVEAA